MSSAILSKYAYNMDTSLRPYICRTGCSSGAIKFNVKIMQKLGK